MVSSFFEVLGKKLREPLRNSYSTKNTKKSQKTLSKMQKELNTINHQTSVM